MYFFLFFILIIDTGNTQVEMSELQSCDCYGEAFLTVQQYRNRRVLTGLFIPEAVLLVKIINSKYFLIQTYEI